MKNPYLERKSRVKELPVIEFDAEGYPSNLLEILDNSQAQWQHASGQSYIRITSAWLSKDHAIIDTYNYVVDKVYGPVRVCHFDDGDIGSLHYSRCDESITERKDLTHFKQWKGVPADESVRSMRIAEGNDQSRGCTIS